MAKLISKTYADALFDIAIEENQVDALEKEVTLLCQVLQENPELSSLMNHPQILKEEKVKVAEEIFKNRISDELLGLLRMIILKDRYRELDAVLIQFLCNVKEYKGIGVAQVTSASVLTEAQKKAVEDKLLETTAYDSMEMHYTVDASLIGGLVICIGDRVVDSSVKTKLDVLTKDLLKVQV